VSAVVAHPAEAAMEVQETDGDVELHRRFVAAGVLPPRRRRAPVRRGGSP
jgi:hypothetical protein